ncbi:hypothetical protein [Oceanithermus sp.]|uniref:hypothetical protein n=1 Tax=Oceanithermus sp. TaxID=2268145 RepID=UPI00257F5059|nr:hypothetical protein [Oceanithermus sp.]
MEVIATIDLSEHEQAELARILGCEVDNLQEVLHRYASAALQEYISMFLGQKVFKRGRDILEYRLFLLVQKAFNDKIPDEQDVSRLFQTTSSESRSLIRSVISKYQYQPKTALDRTIKAVLQNAVLDSDEELYTVTINSQNVVEELNRQLASIDGSLTPVKKKRGSVSIYEIKASSYSRLCEKFNVNIEGENG